MWKMVSINLIGRIGCLDSASCGLPVDVRWHWTCVFGGFNFRSDNELASEEPHWLQAVSQCTADKLTDTMVSVSSFTRDRRLINNVEDKDFTAGSLWKVSGWKSPLSVPARWLDQLFGRWLCFIDSTLKFALEHFLPIHRRTASVFTFFVYIENNSSPFRFSRAAVLLLYTLGHCSTSAWVGECEHYVHVSVTHNQDVLPPWVSFLTLPLWMRILLQKIQVSVHI